MPSICRPPDDCYLDGLYCPSRHSIVQCPACRHWFHPCCLPAHTLSPNPPPPWLTWDPSPGVPNGGLWQRILRTPIQRGYFDILPDCPLSFEDILHRAHTFHRNNQRPPHDLFMWLSLHLDPTLMPTVIQTQLIRAWVRIILNTNIHRLPFMCGNDACGELF